MRVSAGLAKSFLSLEEGVLTAGLWQGLKHWNLQILSAAVANPRLRAKRLWGCVQQSLAVIASPNFFQMSFQCQYWYLDCFGDEGAMSHEPGSKSNVRVLEQLCCPKASTIGRDVQHTNSVWLQRHVRRAPRLRRSRWMVSLFQWKGAVMLNFGMEVLDGSDRRPQTANRPGRSRLREVPLCTCCHQPRFKNPLGLVHYRQEIAQKHRSPTIAFRVHPSLS